MKVYHVKSCGKLYIGGEYAILTPGQIAIIKNIPMYMTASIIASESYILSSDLFDYTVSLDKLSKDYSLIQETVLLMNVYLEERGICPLPFELVIQGKLEKNGKKFGIGSSGSVVVLVLRAMAKFYNLNLSQDILFKLASCVLIKRHDNGSMGDIACIVYDDLIYYQSFDRKQVKEWLRRFSLNEVIRFDWGYTILPLDNHLKTEFLVGWTQEPASSNDLVGIVKQSISEAFLQESYDLVLELKQAFQTGQQKLLMTTIIQLGSLIETLHPTILNPSLSKLKQACLGLNAVAKSSGAGGGDCGIAFSFNKSDSEELIRRWEDNQITMLYREELT